MQIYKRGTLLFDHIMKRGTLENSVMTGEISDRRDKRRQKTKLCWMVAWRNMTMEFIENIRDCDLWTNVNAYGICQGS